MSLGDWLENEGFDPIDMYENELMVCCKCGSHDVEERGFVGENRPGDIQEVSVYTCKKCGESWSN